VRPRDRPHQALHDAVPACRVVPVSQEVRSELGLGGCLGGSGDVVDVPALTVQNMPDETGIDTRLGFLTATSTGWADRPSNSSAS
jgi:hypothetical protein